MNRKLTLGSLFDGIGGFPLAGKMAGITPAWASEIEPFPIRVTEKRLPEMKHYGDVHGLKGADLEPVDIITFGSPCQDLSIAGKRSGLGGSRSGLFYEAVRVITEMRKSTNGKYPRWAVWENVPGALSSQNGQDYRCVLESLVRIKDPAADVPLPESGRWLHAGEILGDGYSLAWRILDAAQGWGVAQRRKRIFAVLDLDGPCAGKVLFESEGVSGYTPPGSLYMIHDPSTVAWGNERDFGEAIALLKACKESILNIYSRRSPIDRGTLAAMMTASTWMDAGAALAQGFIDGVADPQTCPTDSAAVRTVNRKDAEAKVRLWLERCHSRKQEKAAALPAAAQCENPGVPADQLRRRLDLIKPNER